MNRAVSLLICGIFLLFIIPEISIAQRALNIPKGPVGISWQAPEDEASAKKQLRYFFDLGVRYLQIDEKLPEPVWELISTLNFRVYALLPIRFPVAQTFVESDTTFKRQIKQNLQYFAARPSVEAIGLFSFGQVREPGFQQAAVRFFGPIVKEFTLPFYYIIPRAASSQIDVLVDFKMLWVPPHDVKINEAINTYLLSPLNASDSHSLAAVKKMLRLKNANPSITVFFGSKVLLNLFNKFTEFEHDFKSYIASEQYPIPFSEVENENSDAGSLLILMLLLSWLILAGTWYISPVFRRSFYRYFAGHRFYVKDVLERHIRTVLPGASILLQHILLTGIMFYCVGNTLFSTLGREALFYHYPFSSVFGEGKFAFFAWGAFIAFTFETLCVLWLRFINPRFTHFDQIFNLYPWPLQLNIVIATIMAVAYTSADNPLLVYSLSIIFLPIVIAPFIVTSLDSVEFADEKQRLWVMSYTSGLYLILLISLTLWVFFSPRLINVVELAAALP